MCHSSSPLSTGCQAWRSWLSYWCVWLLGQLIRTAQIQEEPAACLADQQWQQSRKSMFYLSLNRYKKNIFFTLNHHDLEFSELSRWTFSISAMSPGWEMSWHSLPQHCWSTMIPIQDPRIYQSNSVPVVLDQGKAVHCAVVLVCSFLYPVSEQGLISPSFCERES